jgi:methylmalonyl-CoA/ethylmalonyl-CoA epimerase
METGLAFFDCGGVRLMLGLPDGPDAPRQAGIVYYVVPDLDAPHLVARMPDHEPWMAFCRDSEQNLLALMSEVRPDAAG